jgi:hypothetical protein
MQQPKEEAPMNTTIAAVNPSTANTNKQQKQTAKEVIAANVQALIEQLEQGHSEALTAYLTAMGRFHNYSFGNILEIARQKPDATRVAGLYAWNQLGRKVKKGEHGTRGCARLGQHVHLYGGSFQSGGSKKELGCVPGRPRISRGA